MTGCAAVSITHLWGRTGAGQATSGRRSHRWPRRGRWRRSPACTRWRCCPWDCRTPSGLHSKRPPAHLEGDTSHLQDRQMSRLQVIGQPSQWKMVKHASQQAPPSCAHLHRWGERSTSRPACTRPHWIPSGSPPDSGTGPRSGRCRTAPRGFSARRLKLSEVPRSQWLEEKRPRVPG